jgi:uncharacterized protein YbaP (TraB family)
MRAEFSKHMAEKDLTQAQRLIVEAEENVKRAEQVFEEFKVFIVEESDRLYKKVIVQKVTKLSEDVLNAILSTLKNNVFNYEETEKMKKTIWKRQKKSCRKENGSIGSQ